MPNHMIEVSQLTKIYRSPIKQEGLWGQFRSLIKPSYHYKTAVDHLSFEIEEGEIVGFIGRNGAGKSTTIKMLTGILYPDQGYVRVGGIEPYKKKKENAWQMGVVFGQRTQLWWDIPVRDTFEVLKALYKIPDAVYKERLEQFMTLFEMSAFIDQPVRQLSLGQRMCADLCAAMLHQPKVIYLDEPTIGLDFINKERIRTFIKEMNEVFHTTVMITSHDLQDIEALCSRYLVIEKGQLVTNQEIQKEEQIEQCLRQLYEIS